MQRYRLCPVPPPVPLPVYMCVWDVTKTKMGGGHSPGCQLLGIWGRVASNAQFDAFFVAAAASMNV